MSRLVTSLFYERSDAERAIDALKAQGIPSDDIYLEAEVSPPGVDRRKSQEVGRLERERRFAGLETGIVIGVTVGVLAGVAVGLLADGMMDMMRAVDRSAAFSLPATLRNPLMSALVGALAGLIAGGLIGWIVDYTLTRLGAGPALPQHETLVTVRADEDKVDQIETALFKARARHLHVAERAV